MRITIELLLIIAVFLGGLKLGYDGAYEEMYKFAGISPTEDQKLVGHTYNL